MEVQKRLLEYGIKPSVQRLAVMDYLMKHRTHPTVDEIYKALYPTIPTLSKTTVYNTLKLLYESGAAQMLNIYEKKSCFDADITPHGHFLCKMCGKVFDFDLPNEDYQKHIKELSSSQIDEFHYYFKGICKKCLAKKTK